jgi:hypothetical protein
MCAKIVEIIGSPGIGKSTIYDALSKSWESGSCWISQEALLMPRLSVKHFKSSLKYQLLTMMGRKAKKSIPMEYGLRFIREHQDLAHFCWNHLSDQETYRNDEIDKRYRSTFLLNTDFCRYQAIMESECDKPCIINEGLLQKSFLILDDKNKMEEVAGKYIPLLPLPHAVIHINTMDKSIITSRLLNRKKILPSHHGKSIKELIDDIEKWQYLTACIIEIMNLKKIPVYNINAERPVAENVSLIKRFFNKTQQITIA